MKRYIVIFVLLILTIRLFSQDLLFEQDIKLKSVFTDRRESLPIVNVDKKEIGLFLLDMTKINCLIFNNEYELIDEYTTDRPNIKFNVLLGHSIDSSTYHLFFTNDIKDQFYIKSINISQKVWNGKQAEIRLNDEKFLETISYKGKFYLLTIKRMTSILKLYIFDGNMLSGTEQFDFSSYKFSKSKYSTLFAALNETPYQLQWTIMIHKIDINNPNPLDLTTKENKIYYFDDKIFLTLDNELDDTKLITIDLDNFSHTMKIYNQSIINYNTAFRLKSNSNLFYKTKLKYGDVFGINSNSYLFLNYLFQVKAYKKELCFQITNLLNDSIIKEYRVKDDEEITFKNTPLIQKGGTSKYTQNTERELDKTKQLLRKISGSDIGISVRPTPKNFELTIGGFYEAKRTSGSSSGSGGMVISSPGTTIHSNYGTYSTPPTYSYNPTMQGYSEYSYKSSVYFKSLFDKVTFNHIEGNISDNVYDKIRDFEDDISDISTETIFRVNDYYILGYYKKWDKKYYLRKFTK